MTVWCISVLYTSYCNCRRICRQGEGYIKMCFNLAINFTVKLAVYLVSYYTSEMFPVSNYVGAEPLCTCTGNKIFCQQDHLYIYIAVSRAFNTWGNRALPCSVRTAPASAHSLDRPRSVYTWYPKGILHTLRSFLGQLRKSWMTCFTLSYSYSNLLYIAALGIQSSGTTGPWRFTSAGLDECTIFSSKTVHTRSTCMAL